MPSQAVIVIPAFDPPEKELSLLLEALYARSNGRKILLFNDGSKKEMEPFFRSLQAEYPTLLFLEHEKNMGKGCALRKSFSFLLERFPSSPIVTADSDGQHTAGDILHLVRRIEEGKEDLLLGVRDFSSGKVPFRSKFGNSLTAGLFHLLAGVKIRDTQTGLRALSPDFAAHILRKLSGRHYEFEMEMLVEACRRKFVTGEEKITTIYLESNQKSHFRPVMDSCRICWKLFSSFLKK